MAKVDEFHWRDIKHFRLPFWVVAIDTLCFYISLLCFNNISNEFMGVKYGFSSREAGKITSILNAVSAVISPCIGFLIDKVGYRIHL